mmetsp:Transcript_4589/g.7103  ORF Transcript_4589/g.7103 Transcript_4589/m.7103 type:complete len:372 (+) Transcript_4589:127-1242(+)
MAGVLFTAPILCVPSRVTSNLFVSNGVCKPQHSALKRSSQNFGFQRKLALFTARQPSRQFSRCSRTFSVSASAEAVNPAIVVDKVDEDAAYDALDKANEQGFEAVVKCLDDMKARNIIKLWNSYPSVSARQVPVYELKTVGIKSPEKLSGESPENERNAVAAFIGVISVLAVLGTFLPGDWGFFVPYLTGGSVLVLLGIGSTSPGLLYIPIELFARLDPEYRKRIARHEAAHFLAGYLQGVAVKGYATDTRLTAVQFWEEDLIMKRKLGKLSREDVDKYSIVILSGVAAEGLVYEEAQGGIADFAAAAELFRSVQMTGADQNNQLRWGVLMAASLIKTHKEPFDSLITALTEGKRVADCVRAIESAASAQS